MSEQTHYDDPLNLAQWATAVAYIANHYRQSFSQGALTAATEWAPQKSLPVALKYLCRHAGLSCQIFNDGKHTISAWRLPIVFQLKDGQIGIIESFSQDNNIAVRFVSEISLLNHYPLEVFLPEMANIVAFRPSAPGKDIRNASYIAGFQPDWLKKIILTDLRPYIHVMMASLATNTLALAGILFSMQVYDRVIPAQSYPTLYVLFSGVILAAIFGLILKVSRGHVTDLLGKRADIRVSDRVFAHALHLKNSSVPRSTGSFISQIRELEQVRDMVTSTTMTLLADMPFFLLFQLVLFVVSPWLSWIAPLAMIIMIAPGLLLQKKLATLANQSVHEVTLRNAILVESIQGLQDIKMMQAESRFLQQWNNYVGITAESGVKTRRITHGLISWGATVQNILYAAVVVIGAPLVISGDITTGAMVAASLLSTRMVAPMAGLCGVLARWQQVKAAKASLDALMSLPVEGGQGETRVHRAVLHGDYEFRQAAFRYGKEEGVLPLKIERLSIKAGEKIAVIGRIGAGKSTLLQAMVSNVELVSGEVRLDDLSLPQIDIADIRRNACLLSQDARLFHGTLRDNVILGRPVATDDEIFAALEICCGGDFVRRLPLGLEHPVMEGGTGLSGGQRQTILLARTLLRDPNIILLDEPTAFFDEPTEKTFIERLSVWAANRTMIIATHRASTLKIVDRVLVIQDGQLVMDKPRETLFEQEKARGQVVHL